MSKVYRIGKVVYVEIDGVTISLQSKDDVNTLMFALLPQLQDVKDKILDHVYDALIEVFEEIKHKNEVIHA
ncbi:hypothetical protein SCLARK_00891 [Spiroplasma clarkii]|uniref:Uncharacterized protein n=1 Tax=Spiroplasma clarkii TaxID=2139 RepID=A0A1Y0L0F3_9MOLU|nr:hypothetical protein [Spiroplasma clarkii]ARU91502.1 hypothetical protein SCLARK_00891 [Spiroplasma clarkii]ATX70917.1 hypothetical protein SCLAR_v1c05980 [Spiroplasma clarkii]